MAEHDGLEQAVKEAEAWAETFDTAGASGLDDWVRFDALVGRLVHLRRDVESELARALPDDRHEGDGWVVERRWSKPRTQWQNDALRERLRAEVVARAQATADGEVLTTAVEGAERAWELTNEVNRIDGSSSRVAVLRAWDVDPDEYCTAGASVPSLQVHR